MIHDRKSQNIHANWPPFISKCLAIYIYGKGFYLVTSFTRHARIRIQIHIQNWTCVHISTCPMKLVTGHKPSPIDIYIYILHKSNYSYEDYIWNGVLTYTNILKQFDWHKVQSCFLTRSKARTGFLFHIDIFLFHPIR